MGKNHESWEKKYLQTILEVNGQKMPEQIAATRAAIAGRLRDLEHDSDHHMERHKMEDALTALKTLEMETRNWQPLTNFTIHQRWGSESLMSGPRFGKHQRQLFVPQSDPSQC